MEAKINIAEILKDKPQGTKLHDLLRNIDVELDKVHTTDVGTYIECTSTNEVGSTLMFNYSELGTETCWLDGLQILLPSKEMRDWSKFAWKKGDILVRNDGKTHVIFNRWYDDNYISFYGKYYLNNKNKDKVFYHKLSVCTTENCSLEDKDSAKVYINSIEEILCGKLNLETLKIEKTQPEFKDGDVVFVRCERYCFIEIFNYLKNDGLNDYASLNTTIQKIDIGGKYKIFKDEIVEIRLATDSEKKQLFEALAKEGKAWDAKRKAIVDLKPNVELKPFDKVLVRNDKKDQWSANIFSYQVRDMFHCLGEGYWRYCITYEGNESLLGTNKDVEGYEENQK